MAKIDSDLLFKLECDSRELQCIALDLDDIGIWRGDRFGGDFRTSARVRHLVDAVRRAGARP